MRRRKKEIASLSDNRERERGEERMEKEVATEEEEVRTAGAGGRKTHKKRHEARNIVAARGTSVVFK